MRPRSTNELTGLAQFDRQLAWAVYLLQKGETDMSLAKLERLVEQAKRIQASTERAGQVADDTDATLNSFDENIGKMESFRQKVREHDNNIAATLKLLGNFDFDKIMGEDGGGAGQALADTKTPAVPITDRNGVTLNPDHKPEG